MSFTFIGFNHKDNLCLLLLYPTTNDNDVDDVLDFYDDAPENRNVGRRQVDPLVRRLDDPDDEARAIIAFLEALNDDSFDKTIPERVPSGLTPGGRIE